VAKSRAAYGAGSMTERVPGVWRLRVMTDRGQVERIFRGGQRAARKVLHDLAGQSPIAVASDAAGRTFGQLLDAWLTHIEARGRAPKTIDENRREVERRITPRLGAVPVRVCS